MLVSVAGDARRDSAVLQPPLLRWGVEAIGLGQRSLVLLHHPAHLGTAKPKAQDEAPCAEPLCGQPLCGQPQCGQPRCGELFGGRQRMGYLLPPPGPTPLLHRALEREGRLPLHSCADLDHRNWLGQLWSELLLLPAHPTVLQLPGWCEAGLVLRQPLQPLIESLWLLLRRGEADRAELSQLLAWWGGPQLRRPQLRERPWLWPRAPLGRLWRW